MCHYAAFFPVFRVFGSMFFRPRILRIFSARPLPCVMERVVFSGKVSVGSARCIGCCGLAPALIEDGRIVGRVSAAQSTTPRGPKGANPKRIEELLWSDPPFAPAATRKGFPPSRRGWSGWR